MSFVHGRKTEVAIAQYDMTPFFKGAALNADVDTADVSCFRQTWKTNVVGQAAYKADLDGFYDNAQTPLIDAIKLTAAPFVATVGPGGLKNGDLARLILADTVTQAESSSIGDATLMSWSLIASNEVFFGYSLRDMTAAQIATGTGTGVDTGAAVTSASWCAHFHLLAISGGGGPAVTLKVQDSADNVSFADITGVTSGSLTSVGSLRVTGTGNVRRYIRISATISGTTPSVTYSAAFARHA